MKLLTINWYSIFYWLSVADNATTFFVAFIWVFTAVSVIATIAFFAIDIDVEKKEARKWMWWSYPFMVLFWGAYVFTPSKTDTLMIIAGGSVGNFLTTDSSSQKLPSDITQFLHLRLKKEIDGIGDEARVSLGLPQKTPKEKFLDKAKDFTKEQLIEAIKSDTTVK